MENQNSKFPIRDKCAYRGCDKTNWDVNVHLFRFPADDKRCSEWIKNSGNERLSQLKKTTILHYGLCQMHFSSNSFTNIDRIKLIWNATPIPYQQTRTTPLFEKAASHAEPSQPEFNPDYSSHCDEAFIIHKENDKQRPRFCNIFEDKENLLPVIKPTGKSLQQGHKQLRKRITPSSMSFNIFDDRRNSKLIITQSDDVLKENNRILRETSSIKPREQLTNPWILEPKENAKFTVGEVLERNKTLQIEVERLRTENEKLRAESDMLTTKSEEVGQLRAMNKRLRAESDTLTTRNEGCAQKIKKLQYNLRQEMKKKEEAKQNITLDEFLRNQNSPLNPAAETFVRMQFHQPNTPFPDDQQDLAKHLHFHSASAYSSLRRLGVTLPGQSTVRRWVAGSDITPGFCEIVFKKLKDKMKTLSPSDRLCSLAWDEMSIKSMEEYSEKYDLVEGLVDLGPLGRRYDRAQKVFFFHITSFSVEEGKRWRFPVAYFFVNNGGMTPEEMSILIPECLLYLRQADVDVRLLVCDQGPTNMKLYSDHFQVNINKPTVIIDGKEYFISHDFPHLGKRFVSNLRTHKVIYDDEGDVVACWDDFVGAYVHDKSLSTSNLLGHITDIHIDPNNFESMNVKRAFNILGGRFGKAIELWGRSMESEQAQNDNSELQKEKPRWKKTAECVNKMNDIIDACNSSSMFATNPNRRPLCDDNPQIRELILDLIQWSRKFRVRSGKGFKVVPCFWGLQLTGNALIGVHESISKQYPGFKLATARANQDALENWFSILRARNGNCPNPTARMVRLTTRHALSTSLIHVGDRGNVSSDDTPFLISFGPFPVSKATTSNPQSSKQASLQGDVENIDVDNIEGTMDTIQQYDDDLQVENTTHSQQPTSLYEANSIAFFAGYVAFKYLNKLKCEDCRATMTKSPMEARSNSELYIELREYENGDIDAPRVTKLTRPREHFSEIVKMELLGFDRVWRKHWASRSVLRGISADIKNKLGNSVPQWFNRTETCYTHRIEALKFLSKVKIFSRTRFNNREANRKKKKPMSRNRKMKNVTNH